jgi:Holliday junction resolvase RusA-like endonuclease
VKKLDELKKNFEESNKVVRRDMENLQKTLVNQ